MKLLPGLYAFLVCLLCFVYGKWRRDRGVPVKAREMIWIMLVIFAFSFPVLALHSIMISSGMTPSDRVEAFLVSLVIGGLPLVIGLCFWGGLRLVRVYIDRARATGRDGSR